MEELIKERGSCELRFDRVSVNRASTFDILQLKSLDSRITRRHSQSRPSTRSIIPTNVDLPLHLSSYPSVCLSIYLCIYLSLCRNEAENASAGLFVRAPVREIRGAAAKKIIPSSSHDSYLYAASAWRNNRPSGSQKESVLHRTKSDAICASIPR